MFKAKLVCNCGASFKVNLIYEEYKDYNYGLRAQMDRWLEIHNAHDPTITCPVSPTVDELKRPDDIE